MSYLIPPRCQHDVMIVNPKSAPKSHLCMLCKHDVVSKGPQPTPATVDGLKVSRGTISKKRRWDRVSYFRWIVFHREEPLATIPTFVPLSRPLYHVSSQNCLRSHGHDDFVPVFGKWEHVVKGYHFWNVTAKDLRPVTFGRALSQAIGGPKKFDLSDVSEDAYTGVAGETLLESHECKSYTMNAEPNEDHEATFLPGDFNPEDIRLLIPKRQIEAFFLYEVRQAYSIDPCNRIELAKRLRETWKQKMFISPATSIDGTYMDVRHHVDPSVTRKLRTVTNRVLDRYSWIFETA